MEISQIREIAIDSAISYYNHLDYNDKGIQEVDIIELIYLENENLLLKLRLSSKLFDVESIFFKNLRTGGKYTVSEVKIIEYDYDRNILLVKPIAEIREKFKNLKEYDLKVISDLKFLVERVRVWYEKNGSNIALPNISSKYKSNLNEVRFFPESKPSPDQIDSIANILQNPFSYVWGAPGTGKTQFVLSYVVLHYIMKGDRIAVLAPTNNALEQVLRGLMIMIEKAGLPRKNILRLGTPSKKFAEKYPEVCEQKGIQQNIEEIDKQINILERVLKFEKSLKAINLLEDCISSFEPIKSLIIEYNENQILYSKIEEKHDRKNIDIKYLIQKKTELENEEKKTQSKINSIGNKIVKFFSNGTSKYELKLEKLENEVIKIKKEIDHETSQLKKITTELLSIKKIRDISLNKVNDFFVDLKDKIRAIDPTIWKIVDIINIHNWQKKKEDLCSFINKKQSEISVDKYLNEEYARFSRINIQNEIEKYKAIREKIASTSTEERIKSVKVIASTLDGYIGRFCEEKLNVSHIFLDEAGYANIIKALTLFNHRVPITFLGDHMQLPPVCEINDKDINDKEEYHNMFLWAQSAIFIENLFSNKRDDCLNQYLKNIKNDFLSMSKTDLKATHRFGESLAKVLDKHVYKINFTAANKQGDTYIFYIHAPKLNGEKRTSQHEVLCIKEFVSQLKRIEPDFIILTPYRDQVKLLGNHLPDERKDLKILTVHGSQGREWDTVILSVVDTHNKWFVDSQNQMSKGLNLINTAVSRAKKKLVIVCDTNYWMNINGQLITDLLKNGKEM